MARKHADGLLSLEDSNSRAEQYIQNIDRASGRLNIMESAVGTLVDRATYVLGQLAIAVNADNADNIALDDLGDSYLTDTAAVLNTRHEGRSLFAGSRGNLDPVDLSGYDPTAGWPPAVPGAVDTSYYQGDGVTATARADDGFELDYGATADEPGFEKLMRACIGVMFATVLITAVAVGPEPPPWVDCPNQARCLIPVCRPSLRNLISFGDFADGSAAPAA